MKITDEMVEKMLIAWKGENAKLFDEDYEDMRKALESVFDNKEYLTLLSRGESLPFNFEN